VVKRKQKREELVQKDTQKENANINENKINVYNIISQCHKCHSLQWLEDEKHNKKHNKGQNNYMHNRIMVEKRHVNLERTTRKIKR
jgi:hypothetical protein